ncbi:MAG: ester cyclase [Acidimicrobiales bacterium]|jgi:predicted SnoaL-like aldol condensation-catalyzing enzyme|nr:ester cyclase [Acidimicrobiales bacterium]
MTTDHRDLVARLWNEIWIEGDLDRLPEIVHDPYVRHTREGTVSSTPAQYARHIESAVRTIRGTEVQMHDAVVDGDILFARLNLHGVNIDTGGSVKITWLTQYRIVDGRIAEAWTMHQPDLDW